MINAAKFPLAGGGGPLTSRTGVELLDTRPALNVDEGEYRRLLGYPKNHSPGERAEELSAWARRWYAEHGRPWLYLREVDLHVGQESLTIDGTEFHSKATARSSPAGGRAACDGHGRQCRAILRRTREAAVGRVEAGRVLLPRDVWICRRRASRGHPRADESVIRWSRMASWPCRITAPVIRVGRWLIRTNFLP